MAAARRQRGRRPADRDALPGEGHAAHPDLPGADQRPDVRHPAAARRPRRRAGQGHRRPDARRPGDDPLHRRLRHRRSTASPTSCARCSAAAPAAGTTPTARTPSTSSPTPGTCPPSSPRAASRCGSSGSGLALDSGGAGRYRGGCGYEKHIRVLRDAHFMSIADRSILACWGVKGGKAGRPFQVTVDPGGPDEHEVDALADAEPLTAGTVVRIRTTGGGGWGDPLDRPVDEVLRDIAWRKVSVEGAREDYGVVVRDDGDGGRGRDRGPARRAPGRPHRRRAVLRPRPRLRDPLRRRGVQRVRRPLGQQLALPRGAVRNSRRTASLRGISTAVPVSRVQVAARNRYWLPASRTSRSPSYRKR